MKKHDQFYELPADRRWYHRFVLWFRRLLGKPAPPRYFIGVDHGNGYERSCRIKIKVNHDGTKEIVEHDFFEENIES